MNDWKKNRFVCFTTGFMYGKTEIYESKTIGCHVCIAFRQHPPEWFSFLYLEVEAVLIVNIKTKADKVDESLLYFILPYVNLCQLELCKITRGK